MLPDLVPLYGMPTGWLFVPEKDFVYYGTVKKYRLNKKKWEDATLIIRLPDGMEVEGKVVHFTRHAYHARNIVKQEIDHHLAVIKRYRELLSNL